MRRDFKKFPGEFFSTVGTFPKLVKVQHAFNMPWIHPSSYDAAHSLPTLLRPLCSGASPPTRADSSPLLLFSFFSRYAKPHALAPSVNSTQCGAPLSHDVPPLPPLPKSAQKRGTSSVQVKAVEF